MKKILLMKVYIVVTEEYYGGEDKVRIFTNLARAQEYVNHLFETYKIDVLILEREL